MQFQQMFMWYQFGEKVVGFLNLLNINLEMCFRFDNENSLPVKKIMERDLAISGDEAIPDADFVILWLPYTFLIHAIL